jgi:predicted lipoprotein
MQTAKASWTDASPGSIRTTGFRWRSLVRLAPVVALVACAASCAPSTTTVPPGEDARRVVLGRLVDAVVLPRLALAEERAAVLVDAAVALDASAGADDGARAAAREAFAALQAVWQQLEVVQVGPAGAPTTFTGGAGLRDGIHSWPQVSPCGVDQQVVQNTFTEPGWAAARLVNVVGLPALEALLFRDDDDNACPEAASINAEGTWAALGSPTIVARRATYARVVAEDVLARLRALRAAWTGGFAEGLRTAGVAGSPFPTAQQALDEVYAALFFVELVTKDRKLAVPAGLHVDCAAAVCPERTESPWARLSLRHVEHNLRGARAVLRGLDGDVGVAAGDDVHAVDDAADRGMDDLLRDAGHGAAADAIVARLDEAIAAVAGFDGSLEDALVSEPERARALFSTVKAFTDELKGTLPSLLGLRVPDEGAGDND